MNKYSLFSIFLIVLLSISCEQNKTSIQISTMKINPLLTEWTTPHQAPPFDLIKDSDYIPAFKEAIKQHQAEIERIATNTAAPTFENTIEKYEYSGQLLDRTRNVFFAVHAANTNDNLKKIAKDIAPLLSNHQDYFLLHEQLFKRIKEVYNKKESLSLTGESLKLLEETYRTFVRSGANANENQKSKLREINAGLASLTQEFGAHVLSETNGTVSKVVGFKKNKIFVF